MFRPIQVTPDEVTKVKWARDSMFPKWTSECLRDRGFTTRVADEVLTEAEDKFASEITA